MKKKILKITGITLLSIIALLFAIPYFFKDQINAKILQSINNNVDAKVAFVEADLSLLKSFPQANVTIEKLSIVNNAPFKGDTLVYLGELNLKMSVKELFKSKDEPINIEAITSKNGLINIIFNKEGLGNFDIALKNKEEDISKSKSMSLKIKEYAIENFTFQYYLQNKTQLLAYKNSKEFSTNFLLSDANWKQFVVFAANDSVNLNSTKLNTPNKEDVKAAIIPSKIPNQNSLSIEKILGYIVLAVNKYGTDWTIYVLKTKERGEAIVYVSDEDELIVSTDYRELFSHYLNQENAEVYQERLRKFLVHYEIIQD